MTFDPISLNYGLSKIHRKLYRFPGGLVFRLQSRSAVTEMEIFCVLESTAVCVKEVV